LAPSPNSSAELAAVQLAMARLLPAAPFLSGRLAQVRWRVLRGAFAHGAWCPSSLPRPAPSRPSSLLALLHGRRGGACPCPASSSRTPACFLAAGGCGSGHRRADPSVLSSPAVVQLGLRPIPCFRRPCHSRIAPARRSSSRRQQSQVAPFGQLRSMALGTHTSWSLARPFLAGHCPWSYDSCDSLAILLLFYFIAMELAVSLCSSSSTLTLLPMVGQPCR
jgi:hypothetical protein